MPNSRTPNGFLVFIGSLAALLIVAAIFVFTIARGPQPSDLDKKRGEHRLEVRTKLEKDALDLIASEGWVDKAKGVVHVPVTTLFASTAKELAAKKPAPSQVKVEPPIVPPPVDPKSTEPPPPALPSAPQGADTIHFVAPEPPKTSALNIEATAPLADAMSTVAARPPLINWTEKK